MSSVLVIGGGAAGYFGAINIAALAPTLRVTLVEATNKPLAKVRISGGGRCNVTHSCFDPAELVKNYPRGAQELRGAFTRFQPRDTVEWFTARGVELKTEGDGRMFPRTNSSETIARCLEGEARRVGVRVLLGTRVREIKPGFQVTLAGGEGLDVRSVLLATGGSKGGYELAAALGHTIEPLAPSLFTFVVADPLLEELSGVSFPSVGLTLSRSAGGPGARELRTLGPLLITHWGLSGPAVLKLSSFGARELFGADYHAPLRVNWFGESTAEEVLRRLLALQQQHPKKLLHSTPLSPLPARFWHRACSLQLSSEPKPWSELSPKRLHHFSQWLTNCPLQIAGKGQFKEEFVTAGGVRRSEIEWRTMESKRVPGLYFAGEVIDVDGVTGGFNFQNAWTTAWLAAQAIAKAGPERAPRGVTA